MCGSIVCVYECRFSAFKIFCFIIYGTNIINELTFLCVGFSVFDSRCYLRLCVYTSLCAAGGADFQAE